MSELSARLGLFVGIDRAVIEERDLLSAAAVVIPVYGLDFGVADPDDQTTVGWSTALPELLEIEAFPGIDVAFREFEGLPEPSTLDQARRLRAGWSVAQVLPKTDPDLLAGMLVPLVRAARIESEGQDSDDALDVREAQALVAFISRSDGPPGRGDWSGVVAIASERRWISSSAALLAAACCIDNIDLKKAGDDIDPVAFILTRLRDVDVGTRSLADVRRAVQPGRWKTCLADFWCDMRSIRRPSGMAAPPEFYQEVVGDCPATWFHPYLAIWPRDLRDRAGRVEGFELQYTLASNTQLENLSRRRATPLEQDPRVVVDSGSIVVDNFHTVGGRNRVDISTSKSIRLNGLPTGAVALVACTSGWADKTRMMMSGCLGI
jgi:hypothetical protein